MAQAQLVVGRESLDHHEAELSALLHEVAAPATARWGPVRTWLDHNPARTPWALLARRDGELVAALLMVRRTRGALHQYRTMGEANVPACVPVRDAEAARTLADAAVQTLGSTRRPWLLTLTGLEQDDDGAAALTHRLGASSASVRHALDFGSPRLTFDRPRNPLSRNTRAAVAKARNRIARAGLDFALQWTSDPQAIADSVPDIVELYRRRSHQLDQNPELLDDPAYRSYFTDALRAHALDGQASLLTVRLDGRLASYAMCLRMRDVLFVYSNRMAPEWARFSPGTLANAEVVQAAYRDPGLRAVDWGAGIQRYKLSGNAVVYPHCRLDAASGPVVGFASAGVRRVRQLVG